MKFQTKMHEVDAISVERLIKTAEKNFKSLPRWIVRSIKLGNLYFGHSTVVIRNNEGLMDANAGDVIIFNPQVQIEVMSKRDFCDRYEGVFLADDVNIV